MGQLRFLDNSEISEFLEHGENKWSVKYFGSQFKTGFRECSKVDKYLLQVSRGNDKCATFYVTRQ